MLNEKTIREIKAYKDYTGRQLPVELVQKAVDEISKQGHSGFSVSYVVSYLKQLVTDEVKTKERLEKLMNKEGADYIQRLITSNIYNLWEIIKDFETNEDKFAVINILNYEPTTPLLGTDDEWRDDTIASKNRKVQQNVRCSSVFREWFDDIQDWIAYDIDSNSYSDNGGITFFTTGRFGRKQITFPYEPKKNANYIYEYREDKYIILTDPKTIEKVKQAHTYVDED